MNEAELGGSQKCKENKGRVQTRRSRSQYRRLMSESVSETNVGSGQVKRQQCDVSTLVGIHLTPSYSFKNSSKQMKVISTITQSLFYKVKYFYFVFTIHSDIL